MPQNPARKARTRAEILDHAARLFRLRGHAGTNIDDIMLAAGLTRGAFYAHFTSKDDLFAEAIRPARACCGRLRGGEPRGGAESLSRQGGSRRHRAGLHPRRPARRRRPRAAGRPAGLCQRPLRDDRRAGARQASQARRRRHGGGDPRGRRRRPWRAPRATRGSATGCCAARERAVRPLLKPRASPAKKRSRSRRKAAGARRAKRAARSRGGRAAAGPKARSSAARR